MSVKTSKRSFDELNCDDDEFVTLYCDILANRSISRENKKKRWDSLCEERKNTPAVALEAVNQPPVSDSIHGTG